MSESKTGGPAFPYGTAYAGMTLRDYFAAKAMKSILGADRYSGIIGVNTYEQQIAADAYKMADAMMKARNK